MWEEDQSLRVLSSELPTADDGLLDLVVEPLASLDKHQLLEITEC